MDGHGWHPRFLEPDPPAQRSAREQALAKYTAYCRTFRRAPGPTQALTDLLAICHNQGIAVRLVLMPEDSGFRGLLSTEVNGGTRQLLDEMSLGWQALVIDARAWVGDEDFWDGHHLLPGGAATFTRRLRETVSGASQQR